MKADVLIVGGGIMGCATAIELANKGKKVIIFEKDLPGRHASGNNSGGVRCQGRDVREIPFAVEARKMWDHHLQTIGSDCGFYVSPRLRLAESDAEMEQLVKREETLKSMGYDHEVVADLEEVRRLSPNVADHVVGGLACYTQVHIDCLQCLISAIRVSRAPRGNNFAALTRLVASHNMLQCERAAYRHGLRKSPEQ